MKTIRKKIFIVWLFLIIFFISYEIAQEKRSPDSLKIEEALTEQVNRFQENVNTRLEALEAANMKQLVELKHRLEALDSTKILNLQHVINGLESLELTVDTRLEQLTHSIRTFESTNEAQIEQLTHRIDAAESTSALFIETRSIEGVFESAYNLQFKQLTDPLKSIDLKNKTSRYLTQQTKANFPRNCRDIKEWGYGFSTIYMVKPDRAPKAIEVLCDLDEKGGGWTHILNRFDGSQSFDFDMEVYKNGFGKLSGEFWLGLDNIHHLTGYKENELLVELVDWDENYRFAHYDRFRIGSEDEGYVVTVSGYNGTAGDSLSFTDKTKFSTRNFDLDKNPAMSCAEFCFGSWWYGKCNTSLLTGKYLEGHVHENETRDIMHWSTFRGDEYSLKEARMMVRPRIEPND
ncbi:ficolin-2-like [Zophobas morio]|uniref:ficolin-2-like n=1 Tax=Zophobas morio TaxID=2755281 RepID=UPI00308356E6